MTLRLLSIAAIVLGVGVLTVYLHLVGKGPLSSLEARHLRTMKDRAAAPAAVAPLTFAGFEALPFRAPLARYRTIERRGASLEGYVQHLHYATDGDYHLEFTPHPGTSDSAGMRYVACEVTPRFRAGRPAWEFEALAAELRPALRDGLTWDAPPRRARLSGWLLYDNAHAENQALPARLRELWRRYGLGMAIQFGDPPQLSNRMSWWEIHPVTRIEVWDETRNAWREIGASGSSVRAGAGS